MVFNTASTTENLRMNAGKLSTGGESSPDVDAGGLCLDQNALDSYILTFKSSDVSHSYTSYAEADTFVDFTKYSDSGGLRIRTFSSDGNALLLVGNVDISDVSQTEATNSLGIVQVAGYGDNGTAGAAVGADDNLFIVASAALTQFIVKGDGELFSNQSATVGTYDTYDDAQLIRAFDLSKGNYAKGLINSKFDKFVKYNQKDLLDANLIGKDDDGKPTSFVNLTGMSRLHNGAIWQQYEKHEQLLEAVYDLAKEAVGEEKANAILDKHEVKRLN